MSEDPQYAPPPDSPDDLEPEDAIVTGGPLDLNRATAAELQALPGVGPALAEEIVAYRAEVGGFREPAEVTRVPGVSDETYALFADQITVGQDLVADEGLILPSEAVSEPQAAEAAPAMPPPPDLEEEALAAEEEFAVPAASEAPAAEAAPPPPPPPSPPPTVIHEVRGGVGWGSLLFVSLLSAAIGALLALLVLYGLNGTLEFRRVAAQRIQGEVFRLEGDLQGIRGEVGDVQGRVAELSELPGQMAEVRSQVSDLGRTVDALGGELSTTSQRLDDVQTTLAGLSDDMTNVQESVTALETQVGELEQQVLDMGEVLADVQASVAQFDAFFTGLSQLLDDTLGPAEEPQTGGPLQTMTPGPGMTPEPTATPRPNVTVIPLATPTP